MSLILTRRVQEKLVIGEDIYIEILSVKGNQVRLGFDAPADVSVHREEIYDRIKQEQVPKNETGKRLEIRYKTRKTLAQSIPILTKAS